MTCFNCISNDVKLGKNVHLSKFSNGSMHFTQGALHLSSPSTMK